MGAYNDDRSDDRAVRVGRGDRCARSLRSPTIPYLGRELDFRHDRTPASAREIADHVRKSTGEKNEVDLADEAMRTATELVEKGMDPEDAMDIADAELGEAMQEPPPVSVDPEAESAKAAAQAAYIAADAAAFYVIGLFSLAADFAELACSKAALCKELRSPTP